MKKKASKAKPKLVSKLTVLSIKMSVTDRKRIIDKAELFAAGNVSAWIRHAGQNYTPKKGERVRRKVA